MSEEVEQTVPNIPAFKKHSKLYMWLYKKRELIWMIFKGRFFIIKSIIDEDKNVVQSEWFMLYTNKQITWDIKPKMHYGFLNMYLYVKMLTKRERLANIIYTGCEVNDWAFIEQLYSNQNNPNPDNTKTAN
jgi:hypothetical protein